ncbi:unnamed protein product [Choristocarpus tenellus]
MTQKSESAEALAVAFGDMVRTLSSQSQKLSRLALLSNLLDEGRTEKSSMPHAYGPARAKVLDQMRSLDAIVADLTRKLAMAREFVDDERRALVELEEMSKDAFTLNSDLQAMLSCLPKHLPGDSVSVEVVRVASDGTHRVGQVGNQSKVPVEASTESHAVATGLPEMELVTLGELERVPKTTRGRLSLEQVNAAIVEIQTTIERRHTFLSKPRSKLSDKMRIKQDSMKAQGVPDHNGAPFITEAELQACPTSKKMGKASAMALTSTLRSLKRLKSVRGINTMTYVVQGG